jgi:hypothetical protein
LVDPVDVAAAGFGGFALFYVTWLIAATGSPLAPEAYVTFVGVLLLIVGASRALRFPTPRS